MSGLHAHHAPEVARRVALRRLEHGQHIPPERNEPSSFQRVGRTGEPGTSRDPARSTRGHIPRWRQRAGSAAVAGPLTPAPARHDPPRSWGHIQASRPPRARPVTNRHQPAVRGLPVGCWLSDPRFAPRSGRDHRRTPTHRGARSASAACRWHRPRRSRVDVYYARKNQRPGPIRRGGRGPMLRPGWARRDPPRAWCARDRARPGPRVGREN
jgi:hypothetical protein